MRVAVCMRLSPAARACAVALRLPRARGLALGYTLSPAARAERLHLRCPLPLLSTRLVMPGELVNH